MKKKTVPAILIHMDWIETIKCLSHEQIGAFIIATSYPHPHGLDRDYQVSFPRTNWGVYHCDVTL